MAMVIDASVALAWCFDGEATDYTEHVLELLKDDDGLVPVIWPLEIANALLVGERRGRISQAKTIEAVRRLGDLSITVDAGTLTDAWTTILTTGRTQRLSAYDASYLDLAARQGLPLATVDTRLRDAAVSLGIRLVESPATPKTEGTD